MRLATVRTGQGMRAVRLTTTGYADTGEPDLGALLADVGWRDVATTGTADTVLDPVEHDLAPVVPAPGKIICVGLNYRSHILEMGRPLPDHPTLFAKFADALIGARDDIVLPPESTAVDWEAELAVVMGRTVRRADEHEATEAIAGFTVLNDVTLRDWQHRTPEWLQGKTFDGTCPIGPVLVTPDELPGGLRPSLTISCSIDNEVVQQADTSDLVFGPIQLVRYISTITTLRPGDIIATGTPGGVGHAMRPPRYLEPGSRLVTEIEHIGRLENLVRL